MKKVLFIDRDGTLIREPQSDYQVDSLEKFSFFPGAIKNLIKITQELDYTLVMVTNQDGLGTDSYPESTFWPYQELTVQTLKGEGIGFEDIYIDRSFEKDKSPYRKPGTALLTKYIDGPYDLSRSFVLGDRWSDIQLAKNLGANGIFINEYDGRTAAASDPLESSTALITDNWTDIYQLLKKLDRVSHLTRATKETKIDVHLNIDGSGHSDINTGLKFFDHMLDQIAKHGQMDLIITVDGDLEVDEHHTIEDTAITLGQAFKEALGKKVGVQRYGFSLPMDECLAQVSLDFGGRAWLVWDTDFTREHVGDMPTEMFYHFFKSFSDHADCNLNIKVEGDNEHHKIESIFKAFARAIRMGKTRDKMSDEMPSTKGVI